jgi:WD40 repeat protein
MLSLRNALVVAILFVPLNAFGDDNPPGAASPDNRRNAVGEDKSIRVFDVATGKEVIRIQAHTAKVTALAFSPDGKMLASGGDDKTVRVYDAATGRALVVMNAHKAGITVVAFSPDGKTLTTVDKDKKSIKWDPSTGKQLPRID